MVELSEALRISYVWTFRGIPDLVWLDFKSPGFRMIGLFEAFGFRMVGLLEAPRFSYGWTFGGFPLFVWLS